jgi:hypothetical protein
MQNSKIKKLEQDAMILDELGLSYSYARAMQSYTRAKLELRQS